MSEPTPSTPPTITARKLAGSAVIVVGMRWTDRLIGFISTLILARLLVPEDFGVIALASLVIGFVDVFLDFGVNITLIHMKDAQQKDFDAAWTLRILQSCISAGIVALAAWPAADYFHDLRITPVLWVLAASLLIAGFENVGIVCFQKQLDFAREFRLVFTKRIIGFLVTITLAWLWQSYWALVAGSVATRLAGVALSYVMHPMRPRWHLAGIAALMSYSTWNLVRSIGVYANDNIDRLLVGRRTNAATVGAYSLGGEIAAMPSAEVLAPLNRVFFPAFVAVRDDAERLKRSFLMALGVQALAAVPAALGMAVVAHELVLTLLGEKWQNAIPFLQWLALAHATGALGASLSYLLLAQGHARITAIHAWLQVLAFASLALLLLPSAQAKQIAMIRLGVMAAGVFYLIGMILRYTPALRLTDIVGATWRTLAAAGIMAALLTQMPWPPALSLSLLLTVKVIAGAFCYAAAILALWWLSGRPDGAEAYVLGVLHGQWRKRFPAKHNTPHSD